VVGGGGCLCVGLGRRFGARRQLNGAHSYTVFTITGPDSQPLCAAFLNGKAASRVFPPEIPIVKTARPLDSRRRDARMSTKAAGISVLLRFWQSRSRVERS
jgi:hypothetical protein